MWCDESSRLSNSMTFFVLSQDQIGCVLTAPKATSDHSCEAAHELRGQCQIEVSMIVFGLDAA